MKEKILIWLQRALIAVCSFVLLLPYGITAFAEDTTLPPGLEEGITDAIVGMEHLPPSWYDEETVLDLAIETIKGLPYEGNADWDGEYTYYTLALNGFSGYAEDNMYSFYATFYCEEEEPIFYREKNGDYVLCDDFYSVNLILEYENGAIKIVSDNGSKAHPYHFVDDYANEGYRAFEIREDESGNEAVSYYSVTYYDEEYHNYQKSNIPAEIWENLGFKAPEVIQDKSVSMNVYFNPSLSGVVDRSFYSNDELFYNKAFTMIIENNSSFPVQYRFAIVPEGVTSINIPSHSDYATASDAVYVFMSKEWVYATDTTDEVNWYNEVPRKQYKATDWHYIDKGETINQRFLWSQIPINAGTNYNVIVQAVPIKWDCASQMTSL